MRSSSSSAERLDGGGPLADRQRPPEKAFHLAGVRLDRHRAHAAPPAGVTGVDDQHRRRPALQVGYPLDHPLGQQPAVVVAHDDDVDQRIEGLETRQKPVLRLVRQGAGVPLVVAQQHLLAGQDPPLRQRASSRHDQHVVAADAAGPQDAPELGAVVVVADGPEQPDLGAERREVDGRVAGSAGQQLRVGDVDDLDGRLAGEPQRVAGEPAVEDGLPDHQGGQLVDALDDGQRVHGTVPFAVSVSRAVQSAANRSMPKRSAARLRAPSDRAAASAGSASNRRACSTRRAGSVST